MSSDKKTEYTAAELFEKIVDSETITELPWNEFFTKGRKKFRVFSKGALRGFKRFMTERRNDGQLVILKKNFVDQLSSFPKIIVDLYAAGDIINGKASIMWLGKTFCVPGFFATVQSQENHLQNGQYCIRLTHSKDFVLAVDYKTKEGSFKKLGLSIEDKIIKVSHHEYAGTLVDLVEKMVELKGLAPMPYTEKFLDKDEEALYQTLLKDLGSPEKAMEAFETYVGQGIETIKEYEDEKKEEKIQ